MAHVTALGASTGCTLRCHTFQGADACGGPYAISLYRFTNATYDRGTGGRWCWLAGRLAGCFWLCAV